MTMTKSAYENDRDRRTARMRTPPIVSPQAWEAARQQLLVKEKAQTRARDALAAERRRMPWMAVEKAYEFEGPNGKVTLLDLFEGRRQLIVYRAFFEPGVFGWPDHACRGCSMVADQVAHLAHLNARDTTLVFVSRAPQADIARLKARMGWEMPWYTITDSFDADFGVDEWHGTNVFFRDGERVFRTYFINNRGDEADGEHLELPRHHAARPAGGLGGLAGGLSPDPDLQVVELARQLRRRAQRPTRSGSRCRTPERPPSGSRRRGESMTEARPVHRPAARAVMTRAPRRRSAWPNCCALGATPTFAILALLTGSGREPAGHALLGGASASPLSGMVTDVPAHERLPFGALAEAGLQPAKRCPPVLIRCSPDRRRAGRRPGSQLLQPSQPWRRPMQEALVVRRETHVPAPPAAVFALLTDPEKILRWMGTEAQVEPQQGGLYLVNVTGARFARGSFREVVPVHRLAYSFGWDGSEVVPPGSSLVEIDLIEQPDGTLLRLTHTGLPNAEQCAGHAEGWAHYLGRLAEVAAGRDPGPDPRHGRTGRE